MGLLLVAVILALTVAVARTIDAVRARRFDQAAWTAIDGWCEEAAGAAPARDRAREDAMPALRPGVLATVIRSGQGRKLRMARIW